ncbi:bifunctional 3-(3-hydroxy-phenyl)propionate/3-hydroxycinnamic acid hydroxylase MhpA [Pseudomonas vancouverensis]|uniref:Bifunctional 3-(3-hydroxy-phenyl)propionate/3-hydroxycinnamic acid hydroxylase n=1 Tax=Pseudomonas vancouverensis TaxID=95300 RepID=A0A1H2MDF3_PSEVA|nr:bifunctional 3-(3-hydroxy-phenyl)propionate/3-hydroxycinnamic acid hydroxylase [Pseudomonas vancouverensis]KAB0499129.1 bifunctional 3-(3-hydroxy-phenyl)propionate/3-hydroxycinnamic acid hydroxylase [Pseudomonas vancouverensis]TDB59890.1 bifunctional 3-(3-hydroxy-phenyl)propionate/3-hydroxycinnamic acid hydroxylase [Pseudomonas vancouverensis]SDU91317.1 3-(3-hydroxy-phenyl)propionate hydroxylase [Pseudomonas vancouverensis]
MNNKNSTEQMVDVVISGLGPTGATLAHLLGMRGLSVIVLEREPTFYGNARAVYTDDECMRVMQAAGVVDELAINMQVDTPAQWVLANGEILGQYWRLDRPFGWPIINFLYQPWLETTLTDLLKRYPSVQVVRGRELTQFEQDDEGVTITHQATSNFRFSDDTDTRTEIATDPDPQTIRARYLVGADGGRSTVREALGIGMSGKNFPEPWLVVDLEMKEGEDALRHLPYFSFICDPECPTVCCPQPGRFHRFEFMLMPGQTKEQMEDPQVVRALISRHVDPDKFIVKRKLVYTFNALVAKDWRKGRVFIAGDAAHMTPQFMGQGMSSGVRDAYNLAWKLDSVLKGRANDRLLDTYGTERFHHAKAMIDISVQMKDFVSMSNPITSRLRNMLVKTVLVTPFLGRYVREGRFKPAPTYELDSYLGLPRKHRRSPEGTMIPQPEVRTFKGKRVLLDEVLGEGYALIGLNVDPREHLCPASRQLLEAQGTRYLTLFEFAKRPQGQNVERTNTCELTEVEDASGEMVAWFKRSGFSSGAIAVVRPDKFTFAMVKSSDLDRALAELKFQLQWVPGQEVVAPISSVLRKSA